MPIISDFEKVAKKFDIILSNRFEDALKDVKDKVYIRDLYKVGISKYKKSRKMSNFATRLLLQSSTFFDRFFINER